MVTLVSSLGRSHWSDIGWPANDLLIRHLTLRGEGEIYFFAYFLFGVFLFVNSNSRTLVQKTGPALILLAVAVLTVIAVIANTPLDNADTSIYFKCAVNLISCSAAIGVFGFFNRLRIRSYNSTRWLARSSFWFNLSHLPVAMLLAVALNSVALPFPLLFLIETFLVIVIPLANVS